MDSSPDFEMRLHAWLGAVGWDGLPFAHPDSRALPVVRAEDEAGRLGWYFVPSAIEPGWPWDAAGEEHDPGDDEGSISQLYGDGHSVVFGRDGEGKSACRAIAMQTAKTRGRLTVPYLDLGKGERTENEHAQAICELIRHHLVVDEAMVGYNQDSSPLVQLRELVSYVTARSDRSGNVLLFVDNADYGLGPDWIVPDVDAVVRPLFSIGLMGVPGLWLKLFLPSELASAVRSYRIVDSGRIIIRPLRIRWTERRLQRYLRNRIEQHAANSPTLSGIPAESEFTDLDGRLVGLALDTANAPRYLNRLVHETIRTRIHSTTPERHLLTRTDLVDALAAVETRAPSLPETASVTDILSKGILFLSANPTDTQRLRCDAEYRAIEESLRKPRRSKKTRLLPKMAVQISDMRIAMLDERPTIVHFCGHGSAQHGILIESDSGSSTLVETSALKEFFELFKDTLECVFLNMCESESVAAAIAEHIDFVIGTRIEIADDAAREFAAAFYEAIAAGETIEASFSLARTTTNVARTAIEWKQPQTVEPYVLMTRKSVAP